MSAPFQTLLLTGAAGYLGRTLAPGLLPLAQRLRVSDLAAPLAAANLPASAERVPCDLADRDAVHALLAGVDAIVHLGGGGQDSRGQGSQDVLCGAHGVSPHVGCLVVNRRTGLCP